MKRPYHVFPLRMIAGCLATNRRIHLCQQCRWQLNEGNSTLIACCGESHHITNHSAAKRDQGGGATTAILQKGIEDTL